MGWVEYFFDAAETGVAPQDLCFRLGSRTKFASQLERQLDGGQIGLHNTQGCHGQVGEWLELNVIGKGLLHGLADGLPGRWVQPDPSA